MFNICICTLWSKVKQTQNPCVITCETTVAVVVLLLLLFNHFPVASKKRKKCKLKHLKHQTAVVLQTFLPC